MNENKRVCNIFLHLQKEQDADLKKPTLIKPRLFEFKEMTEEDYFNDLALILTGGMA